ncbi:uncharacterized protein LOC134819755 isoform X2 [Bolinopsis microptera]
MPNVSSLFVWVIQGSSLDGVKLDCGGAGDISNGNKTTDIPPRVKLTLTLQNEDNVTCTVKDGEKVLETHQITRTSGVKKDKSIILITAITSTLAIIFFITTVILSIATCRKCLGRGKKPQKGPVIVDDVFKNNGFTDGKQSNGGRTDNEVVVEVDDVKVDDEEFYADIILPDGGRTDMPMKKVGGADDVILNGADDVIVDDEDYYTDNTIPHVGDIAWGRGRVQDEEEDYYADNIITEMSDSF